VLPGVGRAPVRVRGPWRVIQMTDDSNTIELNRRRVLGGIVTIGGAAAAAGAGTFAAFSDDETSSGNTVQAGTLDLEGFSGGSIAFSGLIPGDTSASAQSIETTYASDSDVDADVGISNMTLSSNDSVPAEEDFESLSETEFATIVRVDTAILYVQDSDGNNRTEYDLLDDISANDGNGSHPDDISYEDLDALVSTASGETYVDVLSSSPGQVVGLELDVSLPESTGNKAQGEGVDVSVQFTANQQ